ncbi:morphogenetic protein [Klebsiella pneumoniae]|uniref:ASCH domain protein n=2 Tax=Viruses TaxID=10239 RepID=A0AB39BZV7_9CAUD|nr:morphogenetic protein [Klebsiella pneumoniae]MBW5571442.1 morphogenetic protein [Klebsiella pneumoniae]HBX9157992.1 morphogenetic protein [Klebsiella pneumoniae]
MTERGMIFNADMVRAILDGRKTQTRRIVKGTDGAVKFCKEWDINGEEIFVVLGEKDHTGMNPVLGAISCPFGAVGDRIWVRETFAALEPGSYEQVKPQEGHCQDLRYAATDRLAKSDADIRGYKWVPSIHMPRWASRILLEITDVRVERLNSISQEDAQAEGLELTGWRPTYSDPDSGGEVMTPYDNFAELWSSIYGDGSWQANPWVWVISFERIEGGEA